MKSKYFIAIGFIVFVAFFAYCQYSYNKMFRPYGDKGKAYETWETSNGNFKIKVTAYNETGVYLPGAYYVYEATPISSNNWQEFAFFRVDDPNPITRDRIRFVNDQIAYIFTTNDYLVSLDAGSGWNFWKPRTQPPNGEYVPWAILEATVMQDGTGTIELERYDDQLNKVVSLQLYTRDYGQKWDER